ncbi:MAG: sugar phosphate isomerase/epimerase, partial [Clostridiales bacterium]|nr:sugar phosphate isomerase/epimerase [Candidatus Coliplasma equi]
IGIKYDPSHCINRGGDYIKEITDYGDKVYHIHLKGTINVGGVRIDDPPAGLESVNWGRLLSVLQKKGKHGMKSNEPQYATRQGELGEKGIEYTINYFKNMPFVTE